MILGGVEVLCPRCREAPDERPEELVCVACSKSYPIVAGIPDLRVAPDPWIGLEDDRAKARNVLREAEGLDFEGHVRTYWRLTPSTAPEQAERFIHHVLQAHVRSREWLEALGELPSEDASGPWLDEGCGTADLACAAPSGTVVVGLDIAMRWLVIARRRLEELGRPVHLVCANAEALPFPDGVFSRVYSLGMVEHCWDVDEVVREARRGLGPRGRLRIRTVNRYSLLREPHVGLWGVGYLPRRWQNRYVRWRSGRSYEHHHPWSVSELGGALRRAGFSDVSVEAASTLPSELVDAGTGMRLLAPLYHIARRSPILRRGVAQIAPILDTGGVAS